jgi:signal transduction histidine kinase
MGMSEEQIAHVFQDFYRAMQTCNTFKSSGLGMSICKRIVEKHGGSIHCQSPGLGKGTSVVFTLPYVQARLDPSYSHETEQMKKLVHSVKQMQT